MQRGDWLHGMGAAEGLDARFRHAEMLHLALSDQLPDHAGHILDGDCGIDPVLIEQVDSLDAEAAQRAIDSLVDPFGAAARASVFAGGEIDVEAELGGDDDLIAERAQRFADHLFVGERAVDLRRIEEGHAALHRSPDQSDAFVLRQRRAIAGGDAHTAEADG